mmetsp:Transcript_763/g.1030  ORF Transcript_763/g.1030 Transcript_763/m.1030 type:complete len:89 (-) Transcript_763:242-508(-)|eukprot:CAMPEP_0170073882 /NCGR_PEP_ID=MMETSP0019_2-20121128/11242_1 /TAXON_ID=98059 /ORGANISM="Dinobryon sp., Strain UTEXLB2267" /LENGTH=88 /DNA_ID=CAMNT_0010283741 /DNA_START=314 /DNA_END=580 /DNA_ORIENTATION=+
MEVESITHELKNRHPYIARAGLANNDTGVLKKRIIKWTTATLATTKRTSELLAGKPQDDAVVLPDEVNENGRKYIYGDEAHIEFDQLL